MTPRQLAAYLAPCTRADDVPVNARAFVRFKGSVWSTLLSVNK